MRVIPTIRTAQVTLRAMRLQDFDRFAEIWSGSSGLRYIGGGTWDSERAWGSFLRNAGHWQMVGFGQWAIEPHGAREMMGQVGFFLAQAGLGEDFDSHPEAGWFLHPEAQGHGLGRDAAKAAHDWFDRVITGPLVCRITPENTRALSIAGELGYEDMRNVTYEGASIRLMFRKGPPGASRNLFDESGTYGSIGSDRPAL